MLHILMNSPSVCDYQSMFRVIGLGDELLLLSDGVVAGLVNSVVYDRLMFLLNTDISVYAIEDDVIARGLLEYVLPKIRVVDYIGFVIVTEKHNLCISW